MGTTTITEILDELFRFINAARNQKQKVLVQCEWGINRSVTVTVAYLVKHENMTLRDALILLRDRRPLSRPRDSYVQQLMLLERQWQPSRAESDYFRFEELNDIYEF
jgi:protein-tyrosine phosphatase